MLRYLARGSNSILTISCSLNKLKLVFWKVWGIIDTLNEFSGDNEIKSNIIGEYIMEALAHLDQVAYVRFASVYRNFKEAKDFEQFIGNLNVYKSE